jgi:hypothetical protein
MPELRWVIQLAQAETKVWEEGHLVIVPVALVTVVVLAQLVLWL